MNQDDHSMETLRTKHPAEARLRVVARGADNLEAAVAVKFSIERPPVAVPDALAKTNIAPAQEIAKVEAVSETAIGVDGELNIVSILSHIERIYSDQPDELDGERAA